MGYRETSGRRSPTTLDAIINRLKTAHLAPWIRIFGSAIDAQNAFPVDIDTFVNLQDVTLRRESRKLALREYVAIAQEENDKYQFFGYFDPYILDRENILYTRSTDGIQRGWVPSQHQDTIMQATSQTVPLLAFHRSFEKEQASANIAEPLFPNTNYPASMYAGDVEDLVREIHHREEDFDEGDIVDRIYACGSYRLTLLPIADIDLEEFYVDEDLVETFTKKNEPMPPIIFDETYKSLIDGIHRAKAADRRGQKTILAYVGRS
jgi:hypothetical protein